MRSREHICRWSYPKETSKVMLYVNVEIFSWKEMLGFLKTGRDRLVIIIYILSMSEREKESKCIIILNGFISD